MSSPYEPPGQPGDRSGDEPAEPTSPYGQPFGQPSPSAPGEGPTYGQPPAYGQPAYGQPPAQGQPAWGQPPHGQPAYGQPAYGQPAYGSAPGYPPPPYGYGVAQPDHPKATQALVWGLVSLIGGFLCGLLILASPVAWIIGARVRREIDAQPGLGGRGQATAGMVMGIIGTVLMVLGIIALVIFIVVGLNGGFESEPGFGETGTGV